MSTEFGSVNTIRAKSCLLCIAEADDETLRIIANELDLPLDDAEIASFVRDALGRSLGILEIRLAEEKLRRLKETSHD